MYFARSWGWKSEVRASVVGAEPSLVTGLCPATGWSKGAVCSAFPKVRNPTDGGSTLMAYPLLKGPPPPPLVQWGVGG